MFRVLILVLLVGLNSDVFAQKEPDTFQTVVPKAHRFDGYSRIQNSEVRCRIERFYKKLNEERSSEV